jgi:hypothetical protein
MEQEQEPRIGEAEGAGAAGWDGARSRCYRRHRSHLFPSRLSIGELQGVADLRGKYRRAISPARAPPSCFPARFHLRAQLPYIFSSRAHRPAHFSLRPQPPFRSCGVCPTPWRRHTQGGRSGHNASIGKSPRRLGDASITLTLLVAFLNVFGHNGERFYCTMKHGIFVDCCSY